MEAKLAVKKHLPPSWDHQLLECTDLIELSIINVTFDFTSWKIWLFQFSWSKKFKILEKFQQNWQACFDFVKFLVLQSVIILFLNS